MDLQMVGSPMCPQMSINGSGRQRLATMAQLLTQKTLKSVSIFQQVGPSMQAQTADGKLAPHQTHQVSVLASGILVRWELASISMMNTATTC